MGPEDRNVPAESVMVPLQRLTHLALGSTGKDASKVVADGRPGQVIAIVQAMWAEMSGLRFNALYMLQ